MGLPERTLEIAEGFVGVREQPPKSNRGPEVDTFIRQGGGLDPEGASYAWCASFVSYCVKEAEKQLGGPFQFKGGPGALGLLAKNPGLKMDGPDQFPCVFVIDEGKGHGHAGFCVSVNDGGLMLTVEGNTGPADHSAEGDGVYKKSVRNVSDCCGFLRIG